MNEDTPGGVLERLAKGLRNRKTPPADCPNCGGIGTARPVPGLAERLSFGGGAEYRFGFCDVCDELCGLEVTLESLDGDLSTSAYQFPRPLIVGVRPRQVPASCAEHVVVPPHLPTDVGRLFRQARQNLLLGNWDAAGMVYRKTLEVALRVKFGLDEGTLAEKLERVSRDEPPIFSLFGWLTRKAGNEAAHRRDFGEAAAVLLDGHVEQLAVYLFTVPAMRAAVRA